MIYFNAEQHIYYDRHGYILDSPSKILRVYKNKFPAAEAAKNKARKHGGTPQYWLDKWKEISDTALNRGTSIHNEKEEADFLRGNGKHKARILPVENAERYLIDSLQLLPDSIYPEMVIWNEGWRISGKADRVVLYTGEDGKRYADIDDYKTSRVIQKVSDEWNGKHKMMKYPLKHIMDSNYWHYTLQLSIYMYILETHGFKPGTLRIIHIPHPFQGVNGEWLQPPEQTIEVPYLKKEVLEMLKHYDSVRTFDKIKL